MSAPPTSSSSAAPAKPNSKNTANGLPPTTSRLALKGSSKVVSDFFEFSIYSLLYQRGIYPPEDFQIVKKYDLNMMISIDEDVKAYVKKIMAQLHRWVYGGKITKLVVPIINKDTDEVVERWQFTLEVFEEPQSSKQTTNVDSSGNNENETTHTGGTKSKQEIQKEIQAIIRQITASVTFLPVLTGSHTFNVLVYTNANSKVPSQWVDTNGDGKEIEDGELIQFRSFSTNNHKVGTFVSYKTQD